MVSPGSDLKPPIIETVTLHFNEVDGPKVSHLCDNIRTGLFGGTVEASGKYQRGPGENQGKIKMSDWRMASLVSVDRNNAKLLSNLQDKIVPAKDLATVSDQIQEDVLGRDNVKAWTAFQQAARKERSVGLSGGEDEVWVRAGRVEMDTVAAEPMMGAWWYADNVLPPGSKAPNSRLDIINLIVEHSPLYTYIRHRCAIAKRLGRRILILCESQTVQQ